MAKLGRFVTDRNGAFCQITLDSREKILVGHEGHGFNGSVTIEVLKFMRFSSDRIFACDLREPGGQGSADPLDPRRPARKRRGDRTGSFRGALQVLQVGRRSEDQMCRADVHPIGQRQRTPSTLPCATGVGHRTSGFEKP